MERAKGFEPSTSTLARLRSTPELRPLFIDFFEFFLSFIEAVLCTNKKKSKSALDYIFLYIQGNMLIKRKFVKYNENLSSVSDKFILKIRLSIIYFFYEYKFR